MLKNCVLACAAIVVIALGAAQTTADHCYRGRDHGYYGHNYRSAHPLAYHGGYGRSPFGYYAPTISHRARHDDRFHDHGYQHRRNHGGVYFSIGF